jgi:hypothetical protein
MNVRYGDEGRVVTYSKEQEKHLPELRALLRDGASARPEDEEDGTYEINGPARTYYVVLTPARRFAALLDSWPHGSPPRVVRLPDTP